MAQVDLKLVLEINSATETVAPFKMSCVRWFYFDGSLRTVPEFILDKLCEQDEVLTVGKVRYARTIRCLHFCTKQGYITVMPNSIVFEITAGCFQSLFLGHDNGPENKKVATRND